MGADLYIEKKKVKPDYFRDGYNDYNVLWQYGLSWWKDITPLVSEDGYMPIPNIKKFLDMIEKKDSKFQKSVKGVKISRITKEPLPDADKQWYLKKSNELKTFLRTAIKHKTEILCSL